MATNFNRGGRKKIQKNSSLHQIDSWPSFLALHLHDALSPYDNTPPSGPAQVPMQQDFRFL